MSQPDTLALNIVLSKEQDAPNPVILPQMDLLKGATGSVLVIQFGTKIYSVQATEIIRSLSAAVSAQSRQEKANEESKAV